MKQKEFAEPLRLIATMMGVIFLAETLVMLLFYLAGESSSITSGLIDAGLLSILIALPMYFLIFRPMSIQHQSLQRSQHWLQTITENLPEALITIDSDSQVLSFNPAAEKMFGYRAGDIIGRSVELLMEEEIARLHRMYIRHYLETGEARVLGLTREVVAKRRGGELFPVEIQVREVNVDGRVCFVGMLRDITQRKLDQQRREQMHERIERAQRLESLGVLAGGIAHDFNNILAAIMGNAELLGLNLRESGKDAEECLDNIGKGCTHAADLCRQMLAYAGRGQYLLEDINVSTLVREMEKLIRVSIPRQIEMVEHLQSQLPPVHADKSQVEQVMLNLLINAAEAIGDKPGGRIELRTQLVELTAEQAEVVEHGEGMQAGPYVEIMVRDNGCGIQLEDLPRLFEPFFTTKFTGRGLGMSAILGILRSHRGGICIDTEPGQGTTMRVLLPTTENKPGKGNHAEPVDTVGNWRGAGTVLVVDDEQALRAMASRMLQHMGFRTLVAENGEEALEMVGEQRDSIAAILLDLTMPVMGGEQTFLRLRQQFPELPVLIASGYGQATLEALFGEQHPEGFVPKPYRFNDLQRAMREAVRVPPLVGSQAGRFGEGI